jgi:predicted deacylase
MVKSTDISCDLDFGAPGKRAGSYHVPHSSNEHPFGFRGPVGVLNGVPGPTLTLIGGVHGDEYQGPTVISRLFHEMNPEDVTGRIIFLPALNFPAFEASARCSPLDNGNMNRAFKAVRQDIPTEAIAGWLEDNVLPISDAVVDFHAGGKASIFAPVSMINCGPQDAEANMALAKAFGLPLIWKMGAMNSTTSVNAAASRVGVPMMACELGGAGGSDVETNRLGYEGAMGVLRHLGMLPETAPRQRMQFTPATLPDKSYVIAAPKAGLFEPRIEPGDTVGVNDIVGVLHDVADLAQPPILITSPVSGIAVMRVWRGNVRFGERVVMVLCPDT